MPTMIQGKRSWRYGQRKFPVLLEEKSLNPHCRESAGGPTVNWSSIQPKLADVKGDILLLLDYCFAAQAARANQSRAIPPNVELLAASAMRVKTLLPGPQSFTRLLIKHIRAALDSAGFAKVSDIANALAHRGSGYIQTPIRFSGLDDSKSTIRLEPFDTNPANRIQARREAAWLTLRVSLREMLTEPLISDIIQCLKALPGRKISKLTVEKVVLSTDSLHHFIHDSGREGSSGPRFAQLEAPVKHEIVTAWNDFTTLLAAFATQFRSSVFAADEQEALIELASGAKPGLLASLLELENGLLALQSIVQRNVMAMPELYEKREALLQAIEDRAMRDLGFVPLLHRRLKACFPFPMNDALKTEYMIASTPTEPQIFQTLVKEKLEGLGSVLVEYKVYKDKFYGSERYGMGWYGIKGVDIIHRYGMVWGLEIPYHNGMVRNFSGIIPWYGISLGYPMGS